MPDRKLRVASPRKEQPLKVTCHFAPPGPEADRAWRAGARWILDNGPGPDTAVVNDPEVQAAADEWARQLVKGENPKAAA